MNLSFYDISMANYLQATRAALGVLAKGAAHAAEQGLDANAWVDELRLHEDMAPLSFQARSIVHHSINAVRGMQEGVFTPPPQVPEMDYAGLQSHLREAIEALEAYPREDIDALAGQSLIFKVSGQELPFTNENFVQSFSLPNLYFHATTAYGLLRREGVPLSKMDFLGGIRLD